MSLDMLFGHLLQLDGYQMQQHLNVVQIMGSLY